MVYADVPEHADASQPQPKPRSTEEWLEQISGQIQDLVDGLQEAIASASDETDADGSSSTGDGAVGASSTPDQGSSEQQPNTAKKTAAAKRAEVKGD